MNICKQQLVTLAGAVIEILDKLEKLTKDKEIRKTDGGQMEFTFYPIGQWFLALGNKHTYTILQENSTLFVDLLLPFPTHYLQVKNLC